MLLSFTKDMVSQQYLRNEDYWLDRVFRWEKIEGEIVDFPGSVVA